MSELILHGWRRRPSSWAVCIVFASMALACSPTSPAPPLQTPTPTPTPAALFHLSGRMLDENGDPLSDTTVVVDDSVLKGDNNPAAQCPSLGQVCWLEARTNEKGAYSFEFVRRQFGYVSSSRDGYEVDVQWVPTSPSPAILDLHLRPTRKIVPGESTVVSVGPTSSLCTDLEDIWVKDNRCEIVVIESGAGTLTVEARSTSGPAPLLFHLTSGNYAGLITQPAPGALSVPVRGGTYRVMVGIPEGAASQQFTVTTSLR